MATVWFQSIDEQLKTKQHLLDEIAEMGQALVDDAQTEEDKILIDSKVGHVTSKLRHGKRKLVSLLTCPSQSPNFWAFIFPLRFQG